MFVRAMLARELSRGARENRSSADGSSFFLRTCTVHVVSVCTAVSLPYGGNTRSHAFGDYIPSLLPLALLLVDDLNTSSTTP